jgi:hypothetical protein
VHFDNFNNIENKELRTWNRCATVFNILKLHGSKLLNKYLEQFSEDDRKDIGNMFGMIKEKGYESTRARINRECATVLA